MRNFSARETEWLRELDGIELAPFWRRAAAITLDASIILVLLLAVSLPMGAACLKYLQFTGHKVEHANFSIKLGSFAIDTDDPAVNRKIEDEHLHLITELLIPVLYFGLLTWKGKGRSPGKRLCKIRVVSLVHPHLTLWHSVERALG